MGKGLQVSPDARFEGDYGLRVSLDNGSPYSLTDGNLESEARLRVRFYLRLTALSLADDTGFTLFSAADASQLPIVSLIVEKREGISGVFWRTWGDDGNPIDGQFTQLGQGWQALELEWQAGDGSGGVQFWLNGSAVDAASGLANNQLRADVISLGVIGNLPSGAAGVFDLDSFVLRQSGEIGLQCAVFSQWQGGLSQWPVTQSVLALQRLLETICF